MPGEPFNSPDEKLAAASREKRLSSTAAEFTARVKEGTALAEVVAAAQPTKLPGDIAEKIAAELRRISEEPPQAVSEE